MSQLFTAYHDEDGKLICGYCTWVMREPKVLVKNEHAKLVQCQHCYKLNKVKTQ